jgi:hypothetical protein
MLIDAVADMVVNGAAGNGLGEPSGSLTFLRSAESRAVALARQTSMSALLERRCQEQDRRGVSKNRV